MTPSPEESTLKRRLQEILTGFKHGVQKKQGGYGYEEATYQLNLIIQERERLARLDEIERLNNQFPLAVSGEAFDKYVEERLEDLSKQAV